MGAQEGRAEPDHAYEQLVHEGILGAADLQGCPAGEALEKAARIGAPAVRRVEDEGQPLLRRVEDFQAVLVRERVNQAQARVSRISAQALFHALLLVSQFPGMPPFPGMCSLFPAYPYSPARLPKGAGIGPIAQGFAGPGHW